MQFRKYVELRRAMLSGDAWSRAYDKLGANVWGGALSSEDTLSFVVQWFRTVHGIESYFAELCVFVWNGALSSEGMLTSVQWLGV